MANHRMFSNRIANSAKFLQMPEGAQLLYFHMVQRADDDGIVESYPIIKLLGTAPDNLRILLAKAFIKQLNEDQVVVIPDWLEHNTIRADRKVDSIYKPLLIATYPEIKLIEAKPRTDVKDNSRRVDSPRSAEGKLSKGKLTISEAGLRVVRVTTDDEEVTPRQKTDLTYRKVFELWPKYPLNWRANRTEIAAAKNILAEHSIEEAKNALDFAETYSHEEMCPQILKPSDLDRKWINLQAFRDKR